MANGNIPSDPALANIIGNAKVAPVNQEVVQALASALEQARRGEVNAMLLVCVRGSDGAVYDATITENMPQALAIMGAAQVACFKVSSQVAQLQAQAMSKVTRTGLVRATSMP